LEFAVSLLHYITLAGAQPPDAQSYRNLEFTIHPEAVENGVPQAFTFSLVNRSDHDIRVPMPTVSCEDSFDGSAYIRLDFRPLKGQTEGEGRGCAGDTLQWPRILERVKKWKLLRAGEGLGWMAGRDRLYYQDKQPGIYEFWAEYSPPRSNVRTRRYCNNRG
jgi:hypothetical protein